MTRDSDTHLQGGDAKQAPFMGSAGRQASREPSRTTHTGDELARSLWKRRHELTDAEWLEAAPILLGQLVATQADNVLREVLVDAREVVADAALAEQMREDGSQRADDLFVLREQMDEALAALKAPTTEPNPEGMQVAERGAFVRGDDVMKPKGYPFPGTVVTAFDTLAGESRFVVESKLAPGMLHIFSAKQITLDLPSLTSASNLSLIGPE